MTEQPMSRREARELARAQGAAEIPEVAAGFKLPQIEIPSVSEPVSAPVSEPIAAPVAAPFEAQPVSRREARQSERQFEDIQLPSTGPIKSLEPTAIVVDAVRDITNMTVVLPGSGAVLNTGAIDLPWIAKTDTGQVEIVEAAVEADSAKTADIAETIATGINPIPARTNEGGKRKSSVFPSKLRKGWGAVHLVGLSAFLVFVTFTLFVASILLGVIKL